MAYKKPICDCGSELLYEVDIVQSTTFRILKNGKISKKPYQKGTSGASNFGRLICPRCSRTYEYNAKLAGADAYKALRGDEL